MTPSRSGYREIVEKMFHTARVDFVITGHDHQYERTYPVYKEKPILPSNSGTPQEFVNPEYPPYVVVGTGGVRAQRSKQ